MLCRRHLAVVRGGGSGQCGHVTGAPRTLRRRLGTADAVVIGLGAMLGTGVFTVMAPAAAAAGRWLLISLVLAAAVAACNAVSSADLAAVHPRAGGTYHYGRERLGPGWGFLAGAAFLVGKSASCAAAALVFASYLVPHSPRLAGLAALAAVGATTALNVAGIRWSMRGTRLLVGIVLAVLVLLAATILVRVGGPGAFAGSAASGLPAGRAGLFRSAGLLFFAFAGYARIATLGEEVRDPARTIRRAIPIALAVAVAVYTVVAVACLVALGPVALGRSSAPLADAARAAGAPDLVPIAVGGAAVATLSVLLSVLVGVSRTTYAMARQHDLPVALAALGPRGTPWRADLLVAVAVAVLVLLLRPASAVGLSAYCVLLYYAVANAAALRLRPGERRWPRWTAWVGLAGCLILAGTLPLPAIAAGSALVVALVAGHAWIQLLGRRRRSPDRLDQ